MPHPVLLYDGVCGLCNPLVQCILRRDHKAVFRYASLQSPLADGVLACRNLKPGELDKVYIVLNHALPGETLLARSDAVIFVLKQLGGLSSFAAVLFQALPARCRDWGYRVVARNRYRIFGRFEACPLPSPQNRDRFLDV